jgi:hypothetical protein
MKNILLLQVVGFLVIGCGDDREEDITPEAATALEDGRFEQPGYAPQQPDQGYAPQQPQQGYAPQQPQQGYDPQQPDQGYAPDQQQQPAPGAQPQAPDLVAPGFGGQGYDYGVPYIRSQGGYGQAPDYGQPAPGQQYGQY